MARIWNNRETFALLRAFIQTTSWSLHDTAQKLSEIVAGACLPQVRQKRSRIPCFWILDYVDYLGILATVISMWSHCDLWSHRSFHTFHTFHTLAFEDPYRWSQRHGALELLLRISFFQWTKWPTPNGHGQSGWSPINCEGLYFQAMSKNIKIGYRMVSGYTIGCEGFNTNLNIASPLPAALVFVYSCRSLIFSQPLTCPSVWDLPALRPEDPAFWSLELAGPCRCTPSCNNPLTKKNMNNACLLIFNIL